MNSLPGFYARSYPAFRPARVYRVLVAPRGLYFIRTRSLISTTDAGGEHHANRSQAAISGLIRDWAEKRFAATAREIAEADPDDLVRDSKHNFFAAPGDVTASSLAPGALFGASLARWKVAFRDRKPITLEIEDEADLKVARESLPPLLGEALTVKLK